MAVDFDIRTYFTPSFTLGFSDGQAWYKPWRLAYLNLSGGFDTVPAVHQYIIGQRFEDGLRLEVDSIEVVKTLDQGSWARIEYTTESDRDVFEIADNEHTTGGVHDGHMLPRMKFPYRAWEINLKAKADSSFPNPVMFRGMLTEASVQVMSDLKITNQQDGVFKIGLDFDSFDSFNLRKDIGASLWHHRVNSTADGYHLAFTNFDKLTFDQIITRIVAWMNVGRPTTDFPHTYSYSTKGTSPYNLNIFDAVAIGSLTGTVTFTNGSTAVTGTNTAFNSQLGLGWLIRPDANAGEGMNGWAQIATVEDATHLTLTANYAGTSRTDAASSYDNAIRPIAESKGRATWDILRDVLNYMGALEGNGLKYIPTCSIAGVIDVAFGGYDKTHAVDEDFRSTQGMQKNTSTDMTIRFNSVSVPFTAGDGVTPMNNDTEYWIKFTLYRKNGAAWDTVLTIPSTGYEYVPYDANNTHGRKYYNFVTQEITPEDTYKWDADLVTAGSFIIGSVGGSAYAPPTYNYLNSPAKIRYGNLRTFVATQGKCSQVSIDTVNSYGCVDGGTNAKCPDQQGCYPDPHPTAGEAVNAKYGIIGLATDFADISEQNVWNTLCRLNSKRIYACSQNTDSSIRAPIEMEIEFKDGHTTNLVGSYLEIYSPELDEMAMIRCTEQRHRLEQKRLKTTMRGFRV